MALWRYSGFAGSPPAVHSGSVVKVVHVVPCVSSWYNMYRLALYIVCCYFAGMYQSSVVEVQHVPADAGSGTSCTVFLIARYKADMPLNGLLNEARGLRPQIYVAAGRVLFLFRGGSPPGVAGLGGRDP